MRADGAPLDPDGATAHDWLQRELAKPAYADQRTLVQRLWDWAIDRFNDVLHGVGGALPIFVLIPLLLALAAVVAFALTRFRAREHSMNASRAQGVLADVDLSAAQLRARAVRLAGDGAHSAAFLDFFRSITRRAEERTLLVLQPGRTAHEVGDELAPFFPAQGAAVRSAASLFDRVRYGGGSATSADVERVRALDHDLEHSRPQHRVPA